MAKEVLSDNNTTVDLETEHQNSMIFPIGQPNDAFTQYFIGQSYLAPLSNEKIGIYNVTFESKCHNNWHYTSYR